MLSVGDYLVETPPHPEDGEVKVVLTYFVQYDFGHRCFKHFKHYDAPEDAERLRARMAADGRVTPEHVQRSPHWRPHPYEDGSLEQRLARYAEEEQYERWEATGRL
jgi:hypothetical protein